MHQAVSSKTNFTLDVIRRNQAQFAKYMKGLDYLHSIVMSDIPIEEAFAEDKIREKYIFPPLHAKRDMNHTFDNRCT